MTSKFTEHYLSRVVGLVSGYLQAIYVFIVSLYKGTPSSILIQSNEWWETSTVGA